MAKSTLKRNLILGLGISLIILIISSVASFLAIRDLIQSSKLVRESNQTIETLNNILSAIKDAETGQRGFLLTNDATFLKPYDDGISRLSGYMAEIEKQISHSQAQDQNLDRLKSDVANRLKVLDANIVEKRKDGTVAKEELLHGKNVMDDLRMVISTMKTEEQNILEEHVSSLNRLAGFVPFLIIISAIVAIIITLLFYKKGSSEIDERSRLQDDLEAKNIETENRILAIESVASQISKGNYQTRYDKITEDRLGSLAVSLNNMAESLQFSFNRLEEKESLQTGIAAANEQLVGEKTVEELATDILEYIVAFADSFVGVIYIMEEDGQLHLTGSYALEPAAGKKIIGVGEGIAGQSFKSGKEIWVKDVPENETTISYALGKTRPKNIIALPLKRDKKAVGVIELGSLHEFTAQQIEFLNSIASNIAVAFYGAQSRKKLQELLEETQAQAEELQSQHTELESMNAELEAQTQKVQASEEELRVQQEELLQSNQELEERTALLEEKNKLIEDRNRDIQQKSKELEQSTRYKSEFLANMSHELRTPLNSILLLSKLMTESDDLDKQYKEYAEVMQTSGQGLLTLIDEILDLSKIEAGKMTLDIDFVSVPEVISDMKSLFEPLANEKNLALEFLIEDNLPATIISDKMRLEQILKNLLSNAIKFTSTGKVQLNISQKKADNSIIFKVIDTGIGIAPEKVNLVFEAFQQADGSTRRKFGGTGLGLSISRQLSILLKGDLKLESTEGKGSVFTLILPLDINKTDLEIEAKKENAIIVQPIEAEQPKRYVVDHIPQPIDDDRKNIREGDKVILIVEDDTSFAKVLLDFAHKKGYKAIVAVRGDTGLEMAQQFLPLAIILDIQLPVLDGWQVMEALKSNADTRPIPVHIMSSMKFKQESLLRGAVDFINKPVALDQMQQIFKKLEDALSRSPKKVLIVEENNQHAKALAYFLSTNSINTEIVNDVKESIDVLQKHEIDCVILDMAVPDKGAYETLDTIKQNEGLENLPIIVFTGKNLSKGEESRIKQYADSIVVKTAYSYQRILDEAGLFLHLVEEKNRKSKQNGKSFRRYDELGNILKNKTVLIADDDVRNIFSLTKALEMHQMKVLTATDGKEALKVLNENPQTDVVLMDMMMPEMDGYESIREIRSQARFKEMPVLSVTAKAMMGDREKCIAVGASDYISKPVDIDQLVSLLRVWLYDKN